MAYLTDKELLDRYEYYMMQLEDRLFEGEDLKTIGYRIPHALIVSHPKTIQIVHTNEKHQEMTGYSLDEVLNGCAKYLGDVVHPTSLKNVRKFLPEFYANKDQHQTLAFVQYVQVGRDINYSPLITFTKPSRLPEGLVLRLSLTPKDFGVMLNKMEQVVRLDRFKLKHFRRFQQLTGREVEVLRLLANGYSNSEIAGRLFLSRQTVETHRKHLKRKLELRSFRDLMRYAFAFGLVEV